MLILPIGDEPNEHVRAPVVNWLLIAANVLVFAAVFAQGEKGQQAVHEWGYIEGRGRPLTLVTHMFLHGGWMHVIGNMLFLWIFGDNVESRLGHLGYLLAYLGVGVAAVLVYGLAQAPTELPLVGASGAVSGIQGLYFVACPGARVRLLVWLWLFVQVLFIPARVLMLLWFLLQDVLPVVLGGKDDVAHWAHLGGFGAGAVLMLVLLPFVGRNAPPSAPVVRPGPAIRPGWERRW